ncbi:MAG: hydroxyisourate hydrolase [bacterium]
MSITTTLSTHVLDTSLGAPAENIAVWLERVDEQGTTTEIARGVTNADGRVATLAPDNGGLGGGNYRLCFDVAGYFAESRRTSFYNEICINFAVADEPQHYHVPLLLSPYGYSTYRGT